MNAHERTRLRFAQLLEIPEEQANGSNFLRKLCTDADTGQCIVINRNTKKIFSLKSSLSYIRIK